MYRYLLFGLLCVFVLSCTADDTQLKIKSNVNRDVLQQGFHRKLVTNVEISLGNKRDVEAADCEVTLLEHLPPGMYVDLYQLKAAEEFGGSKVFSSVDINVEQPEYLSTSHKIFVYSRNINASSGVLYVTIEMPLHIRYHRPSSTEKFRDITLSYPKVLIKCLDESIISNTHQNMEAPCDATNSSMCDWAVLNIPDESSGLSVKIPVGEQDDSLVISLATIFTTSASAIILMYAGTLHER